MQNLEGMDTTLMTKLNGMHFGIISQVTAHHREAMDLMAEVAIPVEVVAVETKSPNKPK
jgi:hypothetical protein